jgi:hypothetical protein
MKRSRAITKDRKLTFVDQIIVQDEIKTLMNSCVEGYDGTWDCTTDEGREGFKAMYYGLEKMAKRLKVDGTLDVKPI